MRFRSACLVFALSTTAASLLAAQSTFRLFPRDQARLELRDHLRSMRRFTLDSYRGRMQLAERSRARADGIRERALARADRMRERALDRAGRMRGLMLERPNLDFRDRMLPRLDQDLRSRVELREGALGRMQERLQRMRLAPRMRSHLRWRTI